MNLGSVRIGFRCAFRGHTYAIQRPTRCVEVSVCIWCGHYQGARVLTPSGADCRWWRGGAQDRDGETE